MGAFFNNVVSMSLNGVSFSMNETGVTFNVGQDIIIKECSDDAKRNMSKGDTSVLLVSGKGMSVSKNGVSVNEKGFTIDISKQGIIIESLDESMRKESMPNGNVSYISVNGKSVSVKRKCDGEAFSIINIGGHGGITMTGKKFKGSNWKGKW